jgi:hypothetical protein
MLQCYQADTHGWTHLVSVVKAGTIHAPAAALDLAAITAESAPLARCCIASPMEQQHGGWPQPPTPAKANKPDGGGRGFYPLLTLFCVRCELRTAAKAKATRVRVSRKIHWCDACRHRTPFLGFGGTLPSPAATGLPAWSRKGTNQGYEAESPIQSVACLPQALKVPPNFATKLHT